LLGDTRVYFSLKIKEMPMARVKRLVLDVLKPHKPNTLEFARAIAASGEGCQVDIQVLEMDEQTETLQVMIEGDSLYFDQISSVIDENGASLHSIDEVSVVGK
jgi:hypothetical protein